MKALNEAAIRHAAMLSYFIGIERLLQRLNAMKANIAANEAFLAHLKKVRDEDLDQR